MVHLMLQELDQVGGNSLRTFILGSIGLGLVGVVGLDNGNNLLGVNRNVRGSNTILRLHNEVRLPVGRALAHGDIVQALK